LKTLKDQKLGYIPSLDGLRAIAIILVLLTHANFQLGQNGIIGVHIFFALSGFLITTLIIQEKTNTGSFSFRAFYLRRFLRLVPALILLLLVILLYSKIFTKGIVKESILEEIFASLFYFYNIMWVWVLGANSTLLAHSWSLSVEEQFYLFWPYVLLLIFPILTKRWLTSSFLLIIIFSIVAKEVEIVGGIYKAIIHESIFFGCISAFVYYKSPTIKIRSDVTKILLLLILIVGVFPVEYISSYFRGNYSIITGLITSILILGLLSNPNSFEAKLLSKPIMIFIGKISYSLYLWHVPIFKWFREYSQFEPWISFILKFLISFLVSIGSWYFIESRLSAVRKNEVYRRKLNSYFS
jgi:peptidoglycan/LPS O-acetylase OafA/YrhL